MKKWTFLFPVLAVAAAFVGCKEDVELNAPYRSDTVIYGILDPVQDTQWVRAWCLKCCASSQIVLKKWPYWIPGFMA